MSPPGDPRVAAVRPVLECRCAFPDRSAAASAVVAAARPSCSQERTITSTTRAARAPALGLALLLLVSVPDAARAAFVSFNGYDTSGAGGTPVQCVKPDPSTPCVVTVDLFYVTSSIILPGGLSPGVFGWGVTLSGTGDLTMGNAVNASGPGSLPALRSSSCLSAATLGVSTSCQALDDGTGILSGVGGVGVAMFSIQVTGLVAGSQLVATVADFSEGNFTTTSVPDVVLAEVVPEPSTALLLGMGLAAAALIRRWVE